MDWPVIILERETKGVCMYFRERKRRVLKGVEGLKWRANPLGRSAREPLLSFSKCTDTIWFDRFGWRVQICGYTQSLMQLTVGDKRYKIFEQGRVDATNGEFQTNSRLTDKNVPNIFVFFLFFIVEKSADTGCYIRHSTQVDGYKDIKRHIIIGFRYIIIDIITLGPHKV